MEIKEFVGSTIQELDTHKFELLKEHLMGEYLTFSFVDDSKITQEIFCEKVADYFEKTELKTGDVFTKILTKYVLNLDEVVKRYIPKEPSAKKGEPIPPMPRSIKYYNHAIEIKGSRNLTIKQLADYSRIMLSLYMGAIKAEMKETSSYEFSTDNLDLDKIISAMKTEKAAIGLPIGKKPLFDLEELYCTDTSTFVIIMIMYYHVKNNEVEGEY